MTRRDASLRMVKAAIDLFHEQGVNATSVDQILARSKTGKSQFSHYFKNKEGLIHASLIYLHEVIQSGQTATGYRVKTWKQMDQWFDDYIVYQRSVACSRSCPIGTIGADIAAEQTQLRSAVRAFLHWSRHELAAFFFQRKKAGELVAQADPQALADFCIAIMQGGMLLTKMKRETDMFENAAKQARNYLRSLRKQNLQ